MSSKPDLLELCRIPIIFTEPERLALPPSWVGHIPFAFWLMEMIKPRLFVELGTHTGSSYCGFCQAVKQLQLSTQCYAVDTWKGDPHAGYYDDEIFSELRDYHQSRYGGFSYLIRSDFDQALEHFQDNSIDLLHIDGYHTYDAVKNDFETWLPKVSDRGVVIFHDTNVRERDFGVAKFFDELSESYPTFNFLHSFGLGVAAIGSAVPEPLTLLTSGELPAETIHEIRQIFSCLGNALSDRVELHRVTKESKIYYSQLEDTRTELGKQSESASALQQELANDRQLFEEQKRVLADSNTSLQQQVAALTNRQLELEQSLQQSTEREKGLADVERMLSAQLERVRLDASRSYRALETTYKLSQTNAQQEIDSSQLALAQATASLQNASQSNHLLKFQLDSVYHSRSWKLSAPLRKAIVLLRSRAFQPLLKLAKLSYWLGTKQLGRQLHARKVAAAIRHSGLFDVAHYLEQSPEVALVGADAVLHYVLHGANEGKNPHPLFDTNYYLTSYPDVAQSGVNPLYHFIEIGAKERRNPHPAIDFNFYLTNSPGADKGELHPLYHFVKYGAGEGKDPHQLFNLCYYLEQNPDVAQSGENPLIHFLTVGYRDRRSPHPLFDINFYLLHYPDVAQSGINPLTHYLTQGWRELRNPHPLFDTHFYLENYKEKLDGSEDPLSHFVRLGWGTGCNPNPYFDCNYYRGRYPDVGSSGINSLEHYANGGWLELRDPSALFNSDFYLRTNPDVRETNCNPLEHYIYYGAPESRAATPCQMHRIPENREQWKHYLPSSLSPRALPKLSQPVSVIVPIYRGYSVTRACVESVLGAKSNTNYRLLLINDCSPEADVENYLAGLPRSEQLEVLNNENNLGFVQTVNKGMSLYPEAEVVLLNSDTVVADYWLDRLVEHAYSDQKVGTVTPCSNNATLCNFPTLKGFPDFAPGQTLSEINRSLAEANYGRAVEIPTAVGFCMYIRRACLEQIGLFDYETFGKGYGEENDFCMKAAQKGWKHLQACDSFVFHEGEASFQGSSSPAKNAAGEIIRKRYPDYDSNIAQHYAADPAAAFRLAATAARYRLSSKPVILIVTHTLQGGTEKHVQDLISRLKDSAEILVLRPMPYSELGGDMLLEAISIEQQLHFVMLQSSVLEFLAQFLPTWGIDRVHVHHTIGFPFPVISLLRKLSIPFDFTPHDYFSICPQIYLTDSKGNYCGEPDSSSCAKCILERPSWGATDISSWRLNNKPYIVDAERVICPSEDVKRRLYSYYPTANYVVFPHTSGTEALSTPCLPQLKANEALRVAVLGVLAPPKGSLVVANAAKLACEQSLPIEFNLIGFFHGGEDHGATNYINIYGHYQDSDLGDIIAEIDPHLIWFSSRCPETFSYTLSAALASGRPILAPNLGSFIDRLSNRFAARLIDWQSDAPEILQHISKIRTELYCGKIDPSQQVSGHCLPLNELTIRNADSPDDFQRNYATRYLADLEKNPAKRIIDTSYSNKRISVLVLAENSGLRPSPCSFIRVLLPLTHPYCAQDIDVRLVSAEEVLGYRANVLVINRVSLIDPDKIQQIVAHCRSQGIKIIYDLDDDLLALDDHPERHHYSKYQAVILRILANCDLAWFSSQTLHERFSTLCARSAVINNALDENLWRRPRLSPNSSSTNQELEHPLRLLYMGTSTHVQDFELIEPALKRLKEEFGQQLEIEIIGVLSPDQEPDWCRVVSVPPVATSSYPGFVRWLISREPYDIGLCPLIDSPFNSAKSEIKFLDYAAIGAIPVCSNTKPYQEIVKNGQNGLLLNNDPEVWYSNLKQLVTDRKLRQKLRAGAEQTLRNDYPLMKLAAKRLESIKELLNSSALKDKTKFPALNLKKAKFSWQTPSVIYNMVNSSFLTGETAIVRGADWPFYSEDSVMAPQLELSELLEQQTVKVSPLTCGKHFDTLIVGKSWGLAGASPESLSVLLSKIRPWGHLLLRVNEKQFAQLRSIIIDSSNKLHGNPEIALHLKLPDCSLVILQKTEVLARTVLASSGKSSSTVALEKNGQPDTPLVSNQ